MPSPPFALRGSVLLVLSSVLLVPARAQLAAVSAWQSGGIGTGTRQSAAYDAAGNLLVTDGTNSHKGVSVFRAGAATGPSFFISMAATAANLFPTLVAVNSATGHVYANVGTGGTLAIYEYDAAASTSAHVGNVTPFTSLGAFTLMDQGCFSPDGSLLFASFSNGTTVGSTSVVRVAIRGTGDTWTDTGQIIAPAGAEFAEDDPDPRNSQGICQGLAADAAGNLWVASAADPVTYTGTGTNPYNVNTAAYVRPLRFYQRQPDNSFLLTAEIPLAQRVTGIALTSDGTLYAAEGKSTTTGSNNTSHGIQVWRGLTWAGRIETGTDSIWNLLSLAVAPDGSPTAVGQVASNNTTRSVRRWTVTGLPSPVAQPVEGRITEIDTGQPVPGAVVHLLDQRITTDAAGHYAATVLPTGAGATAPSLIARASAAGYAGTRKRPVRVTGPDTLDLTLAPAAPSGGRGYFAETTLGALETGAGLARVETPSGDSTVVSLAGGTDNARHTGDASTALDILVNGNSVKDNVLYFDVDHLFAGSTAPQPVFITARWLKDQVTGVAGWRVRYNFTGVSTYVNSGATGEVPRTNETSISDGSIYLSKANLDNTAEAGADFGIVAMGGFRTTFQSVAVTKAPPALTNAAPAVFIAPAGPTSRYMNGPPTLYNGVIYAGAHLNALVALNATTGAVVSTFGSGGVVTLPGNPVGRPMLFPTADGKTHVAMMVATGHLSVYDAMTGALEWRWTPPSGVSCSSAPVAYLDESTGTPLPMVIAGLTYTDPGTGVPTGRVSRFRLMADASVQEDIRADFGTGITSAPALAVGMGQVLIGYTDGQDGHLLFLKNPSLAAGDLQFVPLRDITAPGEPIKVPPVLFGDGQTMILGSSNGATGHLYAANSANAGVLWSAPMGGVEAPPWVDYLSRGPRLADTVYVGTVDGRIHAVNMADGAERPGWPVRPVPGAVGGSLLAIGDKVYVGCALGMLVLNAADPTDFRLFSPAVDATPPGASVALLAPGFNEGMSASGTVPGQSIIAMTGSNGRMYEMLVQ